MRLRSRLLAVVTFGAMAVTASAQVRPAGAPQIQLAAPGGDYLTLLVSTGALNFNLVPQGLSSSASFTIITGWSLSSNRYKNLVVVEFFDTTTALSSPAGDVIPASTFDTSVTPSDGPAFAGVFGPVVAAGVAYPAGFLVRNRSVGKTTGMANDQVSLQIDLSSLPQLPAGNYSGTMHVRAQLY